MRALLAAWIALAAAAAGLGWCEVPGAAAARSLQGWWLARQFEAAALRDDADSLTRLGERILVQTGSSGALHFAADRTGMQLTGPSMHLPEAERAALLDGALDLLERHAKRLEDPWSARRLQAFMIVNRGARSRHGALAAAAAREWLAAGGGPDWPLEQAGAAYRAGLALPEPERTEFYVRRLEIPPVEGGGD